MNHPIVNTIRSAGSSVLHFYVPARPAQGEVVPALSQRLAGVLPTYRPTEETYKLITQIAAFHPNLLLVVVDDCSPLEGETAAVIKKIKRFAHNHAVVYLRTPSNALKAGALNFGLDYLATVPVTPEIVFAFDDDVCITADTLPRMAAALYSDERVGAVCSLAMVLNKNANILTRLQALEYHSFNISKIADNEFLQGPLVMQGMLTGFRYEALASVQGFSLNHLIEDYDITARLKRAGWRVKIARDAEARTEVPETLDALWKQRIRWSYGGLGVVADFWRLPKIVFQDLVGHALFLTLSALIIASILTYREGAENPTLLAAVVGLAVLNFSVSIVTNLITMWFYPQRDAGDWALKFALVPEFVYSNVLTLILVGSYLFSLYNLLGRSVMLRLRPIAAAHRAGLSFFQIFGFSSTWGTKAAPVSTKGGLV